MAVISTRNLERTLAQEKARTYAMGIDHGFNGYSSPTRIQDLKTFWYSDKLQLFITKIEKDMPQIFPGINSLIHGKKISVVGSSVVEQQP